MFSCTLCINSNFCRLRYGFSKLFQEELMRDIFAVDNTKLFAAPRYFNPVAGHVKHPKLEKIPSGEIVAPSCEIIMKTVNYCRKRNNNHENKIKSIKNKYFKKY